MMPADENVGVLIEAWKLMVGRLPGSTIEHAGWLATMFGNVPLPFLNVSVADRPLENSADLRNILVLAKKRARACKHGSLLALCDAWAPEDWKLVAAEEGFAVALKMTGMAADQLPPPRRALPELEFRRVSDETTARDLAMINAHAYGMSPQLFECLCDLHLWHEDSYGYVGYARGRAVTAASTFPVAGTMYVAFVATMPDAHGKGYAEAVMRQAIEQGRRAMGLTRLTLHASDMGRPLYQAMGFGSGASVVLLEASK
jgi:GNAT superfamily N-acetyltransferase